MVIRMSVVMQPFNRVSWMCAFYCDIQFNEMTSTLTGPGGSCSCSRREGAMLDVLIKNGGQTLSRNMLLLKIWGPDSDVEEGNLDNYI